MRKLEDKLGKHLLDLKDYFSRQSNIVAAYIFGSFGTEYEHPFSDIDFGIVFDGEKVTLRDEARIEAALSGLLNIEKIDVVNLKKAPVYLQYRAVSEGELISENDYTAHSDFLERVYKRYLDYLPDLKVYRHEYEASLKEAYLRG